MKNRRFIARINGNLFKLILGFSFFIIILFISNTLKASEYIETKKFTFELKDKSIRYILKYIEQDSEYVFFYYENSVDDSKLVSVKVTDFTINEVLDEIFKNMPISYEIKGRQVILKKKEETITSDTDQQKKRTITGKVIDANTKDIVIGATVKVKNTTTGTFTDENGNFSLEVNNSKDILVISFIGYRTVEQPVEDLGVINIELPLAAELLNEVVAVGYGFQKKVSVVGAITNIKSSLLKTPSSSLNSAFAGRLAGVISTTTNGDPSNSDATNFYIRGIGTFGGRATPLIMLDGIEISAKELNNIPSESIESFSILKDASATAIYGARGGNGVMLVTTKAGKENEKTKINVSFETSANMPMDFPDFVDGVTYMEMYNEAQFNRTQSTSGLLYSQDQIENTRKGLNPYVYPNVNWEDLMFKKTALSQRANINVSGGGTKANYYLSLQANHDSGILNTKKLYSFDNNINIWNYIFQSNVDYKLTPTTKIGLRMNAQLTDASSPNRSSNNLFQSMLNSNPVNFPAFFPSEVHENGEKHTLFGNGYYTGSTLYTNPYAEMLTSYKNDFQANILTTVNFEQKLDFITEGLAIKGLASFRHFGDASYTRTIEPYYYMVRSDSYDRTDPMAEGYQVERVGLSGTDYISEVANPKVVERTFQLQGSIEWARRFNQVHDLSAMVLYLQREYRSDGSIFPTRNQGISGRFTYAYDSRYLYEMNFGYNGTERLASGHRFELFPSFAAGWVISNESFFEPIKRVVTNLKLRGSWGLVGNDQTGLYDIYTGATGPHFIYLTDVALGSKGYTTGIDMNVWNFGPTINMYGNQNGTWERAEKINIGLDLELFSKFSLTVDVFRDNRNNILLRRQRFPEYLGYGSGVPWGSVGKAKSEGVDLAMNYTQNINNDWSIDLRGTFTYSKTTRTYSDEPKREEEYQQYDGKPLNSTWGYIAEGYYADQADIDSSPRQLFGNTPMPGDIKYKDQNNDNMIDESDKSMISPYGTTPNIMYGFGATVRYKNLDFSLFFQGAAQRTIMMSDFHPFGTQRRNVLQFIADDYWSEKNPNPEASYPRLEYRDDASNNTQVSSHWMRDGSYLRLKNAEIGYNFKRGRIFLNGNNLLRFSPFDLWDPELTSWYSYPLSRTFNLGVQLTF